MVKKEETVTETTQNAEQAQNAVVEEANKEAAVNTQNLDSVEVPENAEEISQEEALAKAADEVNRLRQENTEIKQQLDDIIKKTNEEAEIAGKQIIELEKKLEAVSQTSGSNAFYIDFLNKLEEKFNNYSGIRRERLRNEFITDIKEEIQRQKDLLTNA